MAQQAEGKYISVSEKLKHFKQGKVRTVRHYPTGIRKLDQALGGGLYAGLTFLGARPGIGKSTFALQIASEIASAGHPVIFYSLEMPSIRMESKVLNRAVHIKYPDAEISADWLLRETPDTPENRAKWKLVEQAGTELGDKYRKLYIREREKITFSAQDIVQDVEQFMREQRVRPVVFVDYLQILSSGSGNPNITERQKNDENINALSSLSNKYDLAVFVISSLNRESYRDERRTLRMDAFKESGGIEYAASVILGLQPRNIRQAAFNYETEISGDIRELELVFLKQRYGISGISAKIDLDFYAAQDLYREVKSDGKGAQEEKEDSVVRRNVNRKVETANEEKGRKKDDQENKQKDRGLQIAPSGKKRTLPEMEPLDEPRARMLEKFQRLQKDAGEMTNGK